MLTIVKGGNVAGENESAPKEEPKVIHQITITLNSHLQVLCEGPLENKLVFLGLLELAKEICIDHNKKLAEGRQIIAPPAGFAKMITG